MKKEDILAIAQEVAKILQPAKVSGVRKRRPILYDAKYLFYCNKDDLNELRKICREKLHISMSAALRDRVNEVLKDAGVTPKSEG